MMTRSKYRFGVLALVLTACTTTQPATKRTQDLDNRPTSGVARGVIWAELSENRGWTRTQNCQLIFKDQRSKKQYAVELLRDEPLAVFELPPSRYNVTRIECNSARAFDLLKPLWEVSPELVAGKTSYLGAISIVAKLDGLTYGVDHPYSHGRVPKIPAMEMTSPWSGRTITPAMVKKMEENKGRTLYKFERGVEREAEVLSDLIARCRTDEVTRNPGALGAAQLKVGFNGGRLERYELNPAHAYTDEFVACLRDAAERTPPKGQKGLITFEI